MPKNIDLFRDSLGDRRLAIDDLNKALTLTNNPTHRADVEKVLAKLQQ